MVYNNKKAISPVVATALLLVVAVVAVVGFQTWFNTYQSGLNVKVEQQSNAGSALTVERLERLSASDVAVYVKNGGTTDINVTSSKITNSTGATNCELGKPTGTDNLSTASTVTTFQGDETSTDDCEVTVGASYGVVLVTTQGVFSATMLAR